MNDHFSLPGDDVPRLAVLGAGRASRASIWSPPGPGQTLWAARRGGVIIAADLLARQALDALGWLDGDDPGARPTVTDESWALPRL